MKKSVLDPADLSIVAACPPIAGLEENARDHLLENIGIMAFTKGQDIIIQGAVGDAFYVLLEGDVEVLKEENGAIVKLVELQPGAYFGEQALLGKKGGLRSATVRALTACRVGAISEEGFSKIIAASGHNRERFEGDASTYVYREITKSLNAFIATELDESADGVERLKIKKGHTLVRERDKADSAFLILSGVAAVYKDIDGRPREVARMGSGQIFGELGVLKDEPRAATVIAESDMELLHIFADAFILWHEAHPDAAGFFNALSNVYKLSQGRKMSVFLGDIDGERTLSSVVGRPTDGVVSTRVLDQGIVVFTNAGADRIEGERAVMNYADDKIKRELRVIVKERKGNKIDRCIVYAVSAEGIESDLGTLYQHVSGLDDIQTVALRRFERTGFLGGKADHAARLCPCLGLGAQELNAAVAELGTDYATLQTNIGVGSICGGCEPAIKTHLSQGTPETEPPAEIRTQTENTTADVPPGLLTPEETQLAALLARGIGPDQSAVTREQVAVRLRATGVRDMNFFIDLLFPGVFTKYARATYATLAAAAGRGIGFGPWRQEALQPPSMPKAFLQKTTQLFYRLGRKGVVFSLAIAAIASFLTIPGKAIYVWPVFLGTLLLGYGLLSRSPSGRFLRTLIISGPARYYRAIFSAFGPKDDVGVFRVGPLGQPTYLIRDEVLVDYILQNPDIYARNPVRGYPPFGEHSVLGGGSSGVWLGYRMLCEEYFAEGYQEDLDLMREIVQTRVRMWEGRESIHLLQEIYRIVVEIRARVFFQTSFECFNDAATTDYAAIVDRVLSPPVLLFADMSSGDVEKLRQRVIAAVRDATRPNSIGGILLDAWQSGDINEREACENAVMYVLAQAPTMGIFWTLYRAAHHGHQPALRESRKEIVKAIKEELRLHAPVTSMFGRKALRDDNLGDLAVTAGSEIILCPMYIHTNEKQWTVPFEYDRQRWTASVGDGKEIVEPKTDSEDSRSRPCPHDPTTGTARYLPFGGGGQACQGRWFAADEMLIVVEEILNQYELEILEDQGLLDKPLSEQVRMHVYNRPFNDVRVKPLRRKENNA